MRSTFSHEFENISNKKKKGRYRNRYLRIQTPKGRREEQIMVEGSVDDGSSRDHDPSEAAAIFLSARCFSLRRRGLFYLYQSRVINIRGEEGRGRRTGWVGRWEEVPRTLPTCQQCLACDLRKHALIYGGFALREPTAPPSQFTREPLRAFKINLSLSLSFSFAPVFRFYFDNP